MKSEEFVKLLSSFNKNEQAEVLWDEKAVFFDAAKKTYGTQLTKDVLAYLTERKLLTEDSHVLDVGCGSGRYTLPLASVARTVTAVDISAKMLELLNESAEKAGITNVETVKSDWRTLDQSKRYDLVFAAMSPIMHSLEGLRMMSELSCGHCVIGRYIGMNDPLAKRLWDNHDKLDPHQGREEAWAIFNLLWLEGWQPEIHYLERVCEQPLTLAEAKTRYYSHASAPHFNDVVSDFLNEDNLVVTKSQTTLALIVWYTKKKYAL